MEILSLQGFEFFGGLRFFCGFTGGEGNGGGGRMWSWGQWWHQGEGGESVMGRGEKRNMRVRREEEKTTSEWREEQTPWKEEEQMGLKIKMARIQRRFWETTFEIFVIFTKLPSLYVLRHFSTIVVNMMS